MDKHCIIICRNPKQKHKAAGLNSSSELSALHPAAAEEALDHLTVKGGCLGGRGGTQKAAALCQKSTLKGHDINIYGRSSV